MLTLTDICTGGGIGTGAAQVPGSRGVPVGLWRARAAGAAVARVSNGVPCDDSRRRRDQHPR